MKQQRKQLNYSGQTTTHALQEGATRRQALAICFFGFVGVFAKFSYIPFQGMDPYPMFGYKYLSQFFWVLGNEIFSFSMGVVIFIACKFIASRIKIWFRAISFFAIAASFFFTSWIFLNDLYTKNLEILIAAILSLTATGIFIPFLMFLTKEITSIDNLRMAVVDFLLEVKEVHYMRQLLGRLNHSSVTEAERMVIKEDADEFDNRIKEKAYEFAGEKN